MQSYSELKEAFTAADADANGGLSLDEAIAFTGRFGCATQLKHEAPVVPVRWDTGPAPGPEYDPGIDPRPNGDVVAPVSEQDSEELTPVAVNKDSDKCPDDEDDDTDEEVVHTPEVEPSFDSGPVPDAELESDDSDVAHIPEWESTFDTKPRHEPGTIWRGSAKGCRWVLVRTSIISIATYDHYKFIVILG